jgi:hypothetical protein
VSFIEDSAGILYALQERVAGNTYGVMEFGVVECGVMEKEIW